MEGNSYLVFTIDGRRLALPCASIYRVAAAAELLEIPDVPPRMRGIANLGGVPVPVMDLRKRPNGILPEIELADWFVFFSDGSVVRGVVADCVEGVRRLLPGTAPVSHSGSGGGERTFLVAYEPGKDAGTLICSPGDILSLTDEEFHAIGRACRPMERESS